MGNCRNMAAGETKMDAKLVRQRAEELVAEELHIVDSDSRLKTWRELLDDGSVGRTLERLTELYTDLHEREMTKSTDRQKFANFTFKFFADMRTVYPQTDIGQSIIGNEDDLNAIYNFLGHCVFTYGQMKDETRIDHGHASEQTQSKTTCPELMVNVKQVPETKRGLLSLGGGCLGEIWKVSKRRKGNSALSAKQRPLSETLYRLTFAMKMTPAEKECVDVPVGIRIRDRTGGLFVPKLEFLPFLRAAVDVANKYSSSESFLKFGKGMLKVCMAEVSNTVTLWETFNQCCSEVIPLEPKENRELFFHEWLRKIVHARLGEFISANTAKQAEKSGKRVKGGQMLRDELFALTKKNSQKTSSQKTVFSKPKGHSKLANKGKTTMKRKVPVQEPGEDSPSSSSATMRPKRSKVRSCLLHDFVD